MAVRFDVDVTTDHYVSDDPERPYPVPTAPAFIDAHGKLRTYAPAADLAELAGRLLERHREGALEVATGVRIAYAWRAAGGAKGHNAVLGACKKLSDTERHIAYHMAGDDAKPPELLIWLAADHLALSQTKIVEAALFHELKHVGRRKGKACVVEHDCEMFDDEVRILGLWRLPLRYANEAFRQMSLEVER